MACPAGAENSATPQAKFTPNVKLDLPAHTAVELGPFSWQKPEGEGDSGSVTDYSGMAYDPHHHRILLFGGGHATTWTDAIYAFDLAGLAWSSLYAPTPARFYQRDNMDRGFWKAGAAGKYPRPVGRHTYDLLVVPNDREELLVLMNGCGPSSVAPGFGYWGSAAGSYDFRTEQWKILPKAPFGSYGAVAEYDPVSKKVIGAAGQHVDLYDPENGASQQILDNVADRFHVTGYSGTMVYFSPDDKMYFIPQNKKVWSLELDRKDFTKSKIQVPTVRGECPDSECAFAYDDKNQVIGGGVKDNKFYIYDPAKSDWTVENIQGGAPGTMTFHCLVYSPVDNAYIFIAGGKTWAYRWK